MVERSSHFPIPPNHVRFSMRVERLRQSRRRESRDLYLAVLVHSLESEVYDDWPELSELEDRWLTFKASNGRNATIRVRQVGLLKLVREAKWQP